MKDQASLSPVRSGSEKVISQARHDHHQASKGIIVSAPPVSSVIVLLINTDMVLNLCSTIVPESDPHRTAPTELVGLSVEIAGQSHGLSMEKRR